MVRLYAVGLSHRTAPIEVREVVDFAREGLPAALTALGARGVGGEAVVLSTCNRAEIYASGQDEATADALVGFFAEYHGVPQEEISKHLYVQRGTDAARHLFRVAAGLDSLVVGEPQILGQVKAAYNAASEHDRTGAVINRLFHAAFTVGKRVRSETGLSDGAVSVSYAAIALARKIFGDLKGLSVVILGAGEMAKLTGVHLKARGVRQIAVAGRTATSAQALATRLEGIAVPWKTFGDAIATADIVVTATGAAAPVLDAARVREIMRPRRQRPLFIIDIAVPRDVEAAAGDLDQVFLYNIDDLQAVVKENLAHRQAELDRAEVIVNEEASKFGTWLHAREVVPTIVALRERFESIRRSELRRLEPKLNGMPPEARARLEDVTRLLVEKLLLSPTEQLKSLGDETMAAVYSDAISRLFDLDNGTKVHDPGGMKLP
jgi:glutamyl-tRNA reductase